MKKITVTVKTKVEVNGNTYEDASSYSYLDESLEDAVLDACEQAGWQAVRYGNASAGLADRTDREE